MKESIFEQLDEIDKRNSEELIQIIYSCEKQVNDKNEDGNTPLHLAATQDNVEMAKLLLEVGANFEVKNKQGQKPLDIARPDVQEILEATQALFEANDVSDVQAAIDAGAEVNARNEDGNTPLHLAAEKDDVETVKLLLKNGANPFAKDNKRQSPLSIAGQNVKGILEATRSLLRILVRTNQNLSDVEAAINAGAEVNARNGYGDTPLHLVANNCWNENLDIVHLLIEKGAKLDVRGKYARTPLCCAVERGHSEIIKLFISQQAKLNVTDVYGYTPLSLAVERDNVAMAKSLLEGGANPNPNGLGIWKPLQLAARQNNVEMAKLLLEEGANPSPHVLCICKPLYFAASRNYLEVVKLLLERGADPNDAPLHIAEGASKRYLIGRKYRLQYILPTLFLIGIASFIGIVSYIVTGMLMSERLMKDLINTDISYILLSLIGFGFVSAMLMPACSIAPKDCFKSIDYNQDIKNILLDKNKIPKDLANMIVGYLR